jgi:hypothetical protein
LLLADSQKKIMAYPIAFDELGLALSFALFGGAASATAPKQAASKWACTRD